MVRKDVVGPVWKRRRFKKSNSDNSKPIPLLLPMPFVLLTVTPISGVIATAIATGFAFSCTLVTGGGIMCWGTNDQGMLGIGSLGTGNQEILPVTVKLGSGECVFIPQRRFATPFIINLNIMFL